MTYDPPVQFLDLPLVVGKAWSTSTTAWFWGSLPSATVVTGEVVASELITVPCGTFEVMKVVITCDYCSYSGTYYLHRSIGPVALRGGFQLISTTVPTEVSSWGRVKALYK